MNKATTCGEKNTKKEEELLNSLVINEFEY
jgi:hypothetical protein